MKLLSRLLLVGGLSLALGAPLLVSGAVTLPHAFSNGTIADADQVNANFGALAHEANAQSLRVEALEKQQVGRTRATALASCKALLQAGATRSGLYWIKPGGTDPMQVFCEQELEGGGWTMVYNSVGTNNTMGFWRIPYAERLQSRGAPGLATNHYNGALYPYGREFMEVFVDLKGKEVVAFRATATGLNTTNMQFTSPSLVFGNANVYGGQFAGGWSSFDYDGDQTSSNCANDYNGVTQHYTGCWNANLGSDADSSGGNTTDRGWGPHLAAGNASSLGLYSDGSEYTKLLRMSRFARW